MNLSFFQFSILSAGLATCYFCYRCCSRTMETIHRNLCDNWSLQQINEAILEGINWRGQCLTNVTHGVNSCSPGFTLTTDPPSISGSTGNIITMIHSVPRVMDEQIYMSTQNTRTYNHHFPAARISSVSRGKSHVHDNFCSLLHPSHNSIVSWNRHEIRLRHACFENQRDL